MNIFVILSFFWPRMTLKKFEEAYYTAVAKHGESNAAIIAGSMKATCMALGLRYVADVEAVKQQEIATNKITSLADDQKRASEKLAAVQAKLDAKLAKQRAKTGDKITDAVAKQREHVARIESIKKLEGIL